MFYFLIILTVLLNPTDKLNSQEENKEKTFYKDKIDMSKKHINFTNIDIEKKSLINKLIQDKYMETLSHLSSMFVNNSFKQIYDIYKNVLPYDDSVSKKYNLKYVNASFVNLHNGKLFIAAQKPKTMYCALFREFISKSSAELIISLTDMQKKDDYLLDSFLVERKYLQKDSETVFCDETYRMKDKNIRRLRYLQWPDYHVPFFDQFQYFYEYFCKIEFNTCIIHCNAGVGRTGTFLLYHIMKLLKQNDLETFVDVIVYLRFCRVKMINVTEQIKFLKTNLIK